MPALCIDEQAVVDCDLFRSARVVVWRDFVGPGFELFAGKSTGASRQVVHGGAATSRKLAASINCPCHPTKHDAGVSGVQDEMTAQAATQLIATAVPALPPEPLQPTSNIPQRPTHPIARRSVIAFLPEPSRASSGALGGERNREHVTEAHADRGPKPEVNQNS